MRTTLLFVLCAQFAHFTHAQVVYDFAQDPLSTGWFSVIDPNSGNGITYDAVGEQIQFEITTGVKKNFIHRTLPSELKEPFCVTFKIHPEANNQNSFFPLALTPNSLSGPDDHPWRMNTPDNSSAGPIQTLDLLGVFVTDMEIRFINRNDNVVSSSSIASFTQPFNMSPNTDYWVKMEVIDAFNTRLSVFSDSTMMSVLRDQIFPTPDLDPFNEIYVANCNGNSSTNILGSLDDYTINDCGFVFLEETIGENDAWSVYPNPFSSVFELTGTKNIAAVAIYNVMGSIVSAEVILNKNHVSLKLEDENGIYFVKVIAEDGSTSVTKVLLQR